MEKKYQVLKQLKLKSNFIDCQYQQKSEVFYIFTSSISYAYLLNAEPSNLVFLKTYNTEFDEIITDQNGRPLDVEDIVNLTLLIIK